LLCDDDRTYPLPWPSDWRVCIVTPPMRLSTHDARRCLPAQYPPDDAIFNLRKASVLTYALLKADPLAFQAALEDRIHQPYRSGLLPDYEPLHQRLVPDFALGVVI